MSNRKSRPVEDLTRAIKDWETSGKEKGEVFTKPEIVDLMLGVSGIDAAKSIANISVLEPSCGQGEFLAPIVRHILKLAKSSRRPVSLQALADSILAFDIVEANIQTTSRRLLEILKDEGLTKEHGDFLVSSWVKHGDFLHQDIARDFSYVVGNPPYVRVENIPKVMLDWYREKYPTMGDRSDLYIPFFEKSLRLLRKDGKLCFICTDRWTKNQYGRKLRKFISDGYSFDLYIDLYGSDAFKAKVLTYPAITLLSKRKYEGTLLCHNPTISKSSASSIVRNLLSKKADENNLQFRKDVLQGERPWLLGSADQIGLVRRLEASFPTLEEAGCDVYIGAATGNNSVFVIDHADPSIDIEKSRSVPVITASELRSGVIKWAGKYVINTYDKNGVVDLEKFPKLKKYLLAHKAALRKRHVAKSAPVFWYKTIDRVYPDRAVCPKLMIPDIKSKLTVVYDEGKYHPNNSIYYLCSATWDLHALKAVLISGIGLLFVQTYTTKIANGYLRFQAQHLRRIRIPIWDSIPVGLKTALIAAGEQDDKAAAIDIVGNIYNLNAQEREIVSG